MTAATSAPPAVQGRSEFQSFRLGWTAAGISQFALACSMIPFFVFGEPLRNPFEPRNAQHLHDAPEARQEEPQLRIKIHGPAILDDAHEAVIAAKEATHSALEAASTAKEAAVELRRRADNVVVESQRKISSGLKSLRQRLSARDPEAPAPADALHPENRGLIQTAQTVHEPDIDAISAGEVADQLTPAPVREIQKAPAAAVRNWQDWLLPTSLLGALAAIPFAVASWIYEDQRVLPLTAVACSSLAIIWQFVVVGIMIGCAIYALLFCLKSCY